MDRTEIAAGPRRSTARGRASRRSKPVVVDCHAHIVVPEVFEETREYSLHARIGLGNKVSLGNAARSKVAFERMINPRLRLQDMDRMGVDIQIISPSLIHQNTEPMEPERALELVRKVNDGVAEAVAADPDRIAGMGIVPLHAPKLAVRELDRLITRLGLKGVEIPSSVRGMEIGDTSLRPFWRKAERLGVPVFVHPAGNSDSRLRKFGLAFTVGQPYEEALAVSSLIYEGVLDRFPGLRILIAHGGGYLPYYAGRQDHARKTGSDGARLNGSFSDYLRKLYYETVIFNPDMLDFLSTKARGSHILMGTDYPFGETSPVPFVRRARKLSARHKDNILGRNAAKLYGLDI